MKNIRCFGSRYLKTFFLKDYKLIFCHPNKLNKFGYANIIKKRGSKVVGAIWEITKEHEKILDNYEQFPNIDCKMEGTPGKQNTFSIIKPGAPLVGFNINFALTGIQAIFFLPSLNSLFL